MSTVQRYLGTGTPHEVAAWVAGARPPGSQGSSEARIRFGAQLILGFLRAHPDHQHTPARDQVDVPFGTTTPRTTPGLSSVIAATAPATGRRLARLTLSPGEYLAACSLAKTAARA